MEAHIEGKLCKNCEGKLELTYEEGLECTKCKRHVHIKCLKRGSVPGGLYGDTFFTFTCSECTDDQNENFTRNKLSWLQAIVLVLYHLQNRSTGLARKGFFHWRHHISSFLVKHFETLFPSELMKKKKCTGTIAGTLSHFSNYIFISGISVFKEPAFWTLLYPRISPLAISSVYSLLAVEKQSMRLKKDVPMSDSVIFCKLLQDCIKNKELLQPFDISNVQLQPELNLGETTAMEIADDILKDAKSKHLNKRKNVKTLGLPTKKLIKLATSSMMPEELTDFNEDSPDTDQPPIDHKADEMKVKESAKLLDPFCHYNTSLRNLSKMKGISLQAKITGGIRQELILSPYSGIYLKPYIRRDAETFPDWLKLMAEVQLVGNSSNKEYTLPPRAPLDYTYIQPEHIPAINSLCNQFFWPGIDLTDTLQYPDFSCIVLYKRLIIGFAFLVPDVSYTESYLSFLFTRPYWRNCGIAKFMLYHLIQTSLGKDITLHVSMNNPVLLLYQKFGFKVENVVLGFYDKFFRNDVKESKHAFFCRLER